jgi:hypothetical protein
MNARSQVKWCQESTYCKDETFLCQDMETDFDQMSLLQKYFPNRVTFLRFEDFSTLPKRELLEISEFLGLPSTEEMETYLGCIGYGVTKLDMEFFQIFYTQLISTFNVPKVVK